MPVKYVPLSILQVLSDGFCVELMLMKQVISKLPISVSDVHIQYVYMCVCGPNFFFLNHTLTIDSPFQTFAVGLLVEFID